MQSTYTYLDALSIGRDLLVWGEGQMYIYVENDRNRLAKKKAS